MDSKVVRADFGIGLICPRAQTCCASPTRTPARLANSPGFKSFRCPSERIKFTLERCPDQSRISLRPQPLESSLGRVPQAADGTCKKFRKPDRVGRRGLSEPREDFSRLLTHVFPLLDSVADAVESSIQLWWLIQSIQDFSRSFSNHCIFIFISSNSPHNSSNWIIA